MPLHLYILLLSMWLHSHDECSLWETRTPRTKCQYLRIIICSNDTELKDTINSRYMYIYTLRQKHKRAVNKTTIDNKNYNRQKRQGHNTIPKKPQSRPTLNNNFSLQSITLLPPSPAAKLVLLWWLLWNEFSQSSCSALQLSSQAPLSNLRSILPATQLYMV